MNERILNALMRLFAILANSEDDSSNERTVVETFLRKHLNKEQVPVYMAVYDQFLNEQKENFKGDKKRKRLATNSVKVVLLCKQMNTELTRRQKFVLMMNFLEFVQSKGTIGEQEQELVTTVSYCFHISSEEYELCYQLAIRPTVEGITDSKDLLLLSESKPGSFQLARHFSTPLLAGEIAVVRIDNIGIFFARYFGSSELFLNGQLVHPGKVYVLHHGASFHSSRIQSVYYSDIIGCFFEDALENKTDFVVSNIEYTFRNGNKGIHSLSLHENTGKLIGIMGGSGAGKSTLLNILNGNSTPSAGEVLINGFNLHKEKEKLEGVIGYVPQDDLLIEELTVYENLFYNAKLCFSDLTDKEISKLVIDLLTSLGLQEPMRLKVGNPLENVISGGQRKRLNIALELIRKPSVLFLDEPTSGLSSRDSENIMDLLKELTIKGKLIFVVIHQPSSEIFKMFDRLLILDTGGYPVYYGNPVESVVYFKTLAEHINAGESECITCGNVNPEQIFNIIETKVLDENGNQTRNRKTSPAEWNEYYNKRIKPAGPVTGTIPPRKTESKFKKPNFFAQFAVFLTRDVSAKLSNIQYLVINFLEAPVLAFILASLVKYYKKNEEYVFFENKNIPAYLFMCVLVALFVGLMVSAEEIIRDRKILKREKFLNLSRGSYLFSKIMIMFFISVVQTWSFVLIGNFILEINGMSLSYWLILFSTSCFANMLGLNISSSFNSVVTIYILIPFLLIPQILLSGVLVKFQELNPRISNQTIVPLEGDIMASRWAFEALAVEQFMNNKYEKKIYQYDRQKSLADFKKNVWTNRMNTLANEVLMAKSGSSVSTNVKDKFAILHHELSAEVKRNPRIGFEGLNALSLETYDQKKVEAIYAYLSNVEKFYINAYNHADDKRDSVIKSIFFINGKPNPAHANFRMENENEKINNLVKNISLDDPRMSIEENGEIVPLKDPVFRFASNKHNIRSHFFAPKKYFLGRHFDTFWVNLAVLWGMSLLLWITLYFDVLKKIIDFIGDNINAKRLRAFQNSLAVRKRGQA